MRNFLSLLSIVLCEVLSSFVYAANSGDVIINELMWMGSTLSSSDEWIELYNTTDAAIDISNWDITKWNSSAEKEELMLTVPAGKTIPAREYFLISRYASTSSQLGVEPDFVKSSLTLSNTNLQIKLYAGTWDGGGVLVDTAGNAAAPFAGDNTKKYSMERMNAGNGTTPSSWQTALSGMNWKSGATERGTPKAKNSEDIFAPGTVPDLIAETGINSGEITLKWTAPYEDGSEGGAVTSYDICYAEHPFGESDWGTALISHYVLDSFIPQLPGKEEELTIKGLKSSQKYYFAIKSSDERGQFSAIDSHTDSQTQASATAQHEFTLRITEVSFSSSVDWVELYNYGDIAIDISNCMLTDLDGTDSSLSSEKTTLAPGNYAVVWWDENGVDETDTIGNLNGNGVIDLYLSDTSLSATDDQVVLKNAVSGGEYIDAVCWSNQNGEFSSGESSDVEILKQAGQWQIVSDIVTEQDCVSSKNIDTDISLGRSSLTADTNSQNDWYLFPKQTPGINNPDIIPPQPVSDLAARTGEKEGEIILTWTATGDDGMSGNAEQYELQYSTSPDMKSYAVLVQDWNPVEPGKSELHVITGVIPNTDYYFTLKVADEEGNTSSSTVAGARSQHELMPPDVKISFDPKPPFPSGRIKISLEITEASALLAAPLLNYQTDHEPPVPVLLVKQDTFWEGEIDLPSSIAGREIVFSYEVQDEFGNMKKDSLAFSCLKLEIQAAEIQEEFTCFPNPFSPAKGEKNFFSYPGSSNCTLEIFSVDGTLIFSQTGPSPLFWDGKNYDGRIVSSGVYCYHLYSADWHRKGKIALLK